MFDYFVFLVAERKILGFFGMGHPVFFQPKTIGAQLNDWKTFDLLFPNDLHTFKLYVHLKQKCWVCMVR